MVRISSKRVLMELRKGVSEIDSTGGDGCGIGSISMVKDLDVEVLDKKYFEGALSDLILS
jgi:hypothetical protein